MSTGFPPDTFAAPHVILEGFQRIIKLYGPERILEGHFKEERELLTAAVLLLGMQKANAVKYFAQPGEYFDRSVDVRVISFDGPLGNEFHLQITDYEEHGVDLLSIIEKKVRRPASMGIDHRDLIVNIRGHEGEVIYPDKIFQALLNIHPKFQNIWLMIQEISGEWDYVLQQVWPQLGRVVLNVEEEFARNSPPHYVRISKGTTTKLIEGSEQEFSWDLPRF